MSSTLGTVNTPSRPIFQGVSHSNINFTIDNSKRESLERLIDVFEKRLSDLDLDRRIEEEVKTQIATIKTELAGGANPRIIKEAGKSLRSITEGVIGNLITRGIETAVWFEIYQTMIENF